MDGPLIENDGFPLGGDVQLLRFANAERSTLLIGRAELQDATSNEGRWHRHEHAEDVVDPAICSPRAHVTWSRPAPPRCSGTVPPKNPSA
jgi:hypothetical protein